MKTTEVNYQDTTTSVPGRMVNYLQVIENSHYFDDLEQILNYLKLHGDFDYYPYLREYLITGIENTIKNGYKLVKDE